MDKLNEYTRKIDILKKIKEENLSKHYTFGLESLMASLFLLETWGELKRTPEEIMELAINNFRGIAKR